MLLCPTVAGLREFYASPLGVCVRRDLTREVSRRWADSDDMHAIAGIGFALPLLRPFLERSQHVLSLMMPHIGGMYWPADVSNVSSLSYEDQFPLHDNALDRIIACHAFEHCMHTQTVLAEMYRVLRPGGKLLCIIPNRRGLWARHNGNPFGMGHPYYAAQFTHRAETAGFTMVSCGSALFYSPSMRRIVLKTSGVVERTGQCIVPHMGGVLVIAMEKQLYASIPEPKRSGLRVPLLVPGVPQSASRGGV